MGHALSEKHDRRTDIRPCSGRVFLCAYATFFKSAPIFHPMVRKRLLVVSDSENFCETSLPDVANTSQDVRDGKAAFTDTELIRENTDENVLRGRQLRLFAVQPILQRSKQVIYYLLFHYFLQIMKQSEHTAPLYEMYPFLYKHAKAKRITRFLQHSLRQQSTLYIVNKSLIVAIPI